MNQMYLVKCTTSLGSCVSDVYPPRTSSQTYLIWAVSEKDAIEQARTKFKFHTSQLHCYDDSFIADLVDMDWLIKCGDEYKRQKSLHD